MNCQYIPFVINAIIAISAVLATTLNNKANNRHQEKLREIDFKNKIYNDDYRHLQLLFEEFLRCAGTAFSKTSPIEPLAQSHFVLAPYLSANEQKKFDAFVIRLVNFRNSNESVDADKMKELFNDEIIPTINKVLEERKGGKHHINHGQNTSHNK